MTLADVIADLQRQAAEKRRELESVQAGATWYGPAPQTPAAVERLTDEVRLLTVGAAACRVLVHLCEVPADLDVPVPEFTTLAAVERYVDDVQALALCG